LAVAREHNPTREMYRQIVQRMVEHQGGDLASHVRRYQTEKALWALADYAVGRSWTFGDLLLATDRELLAAPGFSLGTLALLRTAIPAPGPPALRVLSARTGPLVLSAEALRALEERVAGTAAEWGVLPLRPLTLLLREYRELARLARDMQVAFDALDVNTDPERAGYLTDQLGAAADAFYQYHKKGGARAEA